MRNTNGRKRVARKVDYRALLLDRRAELQARLGVKVEPVASLGNVNEEDQAQLSHEEFVSLRLNGLEYEQLRQVDEAMDRLDAGEYGVCQECEEEISPRRLAAVPWATCCVTCQERMQIERETGAPALEAVSL
ncbi:MAG: TraR/DksA family transcriptional regulator [bacterium]|nr:TraR/DksA family transcriptional regulator [bacterium]